jgi:hypothetical protein
MNTLIPPTVGGAQSIRRLNVRLSMAEKSIGADKSRGMARGSLDLTIGLFRPSCAFTTWSRKEDIANPDVQCRQLHVVFALFSGGGQTAR